MADYQYIDYQVDDCVAVINLNKPGKLSTQSRASVDEWISALKRANNDKSVGAILFTATGKGFCAGGDMKELFLPRSSGQVPFDQDDHLTGGLGLLSTDWVRLIRESKPVIVAFNGFAVGGGVTFFLPADVLIASNQASFHFSFVKMGIVAEVCSTKYLPARVGFGRASEIILSGRNVEACEAEAIGLVDYLVDDEMLRQEALGKAKTIAANPLSMLKLNKQLLDQNYQEDDDAKVWQRESDALRHCFTSDEHKAAVTRFLQRK